ncbi:hypothetical protein [Massilia brevitalea]|uniref:hypothetical protein n=1 Tax=Massilia brevitalea TaxID=442526 RepID=UPI0027386FEA|nr:hypothetical protein [Massilia brevitalea]
MLSAISRIARIAPSRASSAFLSAGLLAVSVHAAHAASVPAADPNAPVPPTRYQTGAAYQPRRAEPATPDQAWKEQNRIVAATPGHGHATHGADPHAGHAMPAAAPADPHAGHAMPVPAPANPHAGHAMPAPAPADPHAGHTMPAQAPADPHAGHTMPAPAPADPHAGHRPAAPAHQHEGQH